MAYLYSVAFGASAGKISVVGSWSHSDIQTEWLKGWALVGTVLGSIDTRAHRVAEASLILAPGSLAGASGEWVYQETRVERAWSLRAWPRPHAVSFLPHSVDCKWVTKACLILGEKNLMGKWQEHVAPVWDGRCGCCYFWKIVCHRIKRWSV